MKVWYDDVLLYRYRVDRKERARLKNVKFTGKTSEKVMRVYIQSIELQLSSTYLHVITVIINWLNAYSTTFWLLYMLLLFKEGKNCMYMHLLFFAHRQMEMCNIWIQMRRKRRISHSPNGFPSWRARTMQLVKTSVLMSVSNYLLGSKCMSGVHPTTFLSVLPNIWRFLSQC